MAQPEETVKTKIKSGQITFILIAILIVVVLAFYLLQQKPEAIVIPPSNEPNTPVSTSSKTSYLLGQSVDLTIKSHSSSSIYVDMWGWKTNLIYKYEDGEWVQQQIYLSCPCSCECNPCVSCPTPLPRCLKIEAGESLNFTWDQKIYESRTINCAYGSVTSVQNCTDTRNVEAGRYKIFFCYYTSIEGQVEAYCKPKGQARCIEKEFQIK